MIIKKIETPSIVIETPNSTKLRRGLNFKKMNYLDDVDESLMEEEDLLSGYGLGYGESLAGSSLSRYDLGSSYKFGNLDRFGGYGLAGYDPGFKNGPGYDPIGALNGYPPSYAGYANNRDATSRDAYLKKNRVDVVDPPEDGPNEIKSRGSSMPENYQSRNQFRATSDDRPFGKREDGRYRDKFVDRLNDKYADKYVDNNGDKYGDKYADKYEYQESFSQSNRNSSKSGNYAKQVGLRINILLLNSNHLANQLFCSQGGSLLGDQLITDPPKVIIIDETN